MCHRPGWAFNANCFHAATYFLQQFSRFLPKTATETGASENACNSVVNRFQCFPKSRFAELGAGLDAIFLKLTNTFTFLTIC